MVTDRRTAYASGTTLGYANYDAPEVVISLYGPRGGKAGYHCLSPVEARRFAQELLDAADEIDPPRQLPGHNIYFRGYEIEPLIDPEETGDWIPVEWPRATCFRIYPPNVNEPSLDCAPETLNEAKQEVINALG